MSISSIANKLSACQRAVLIEHVPAKMPVSNEIDAAAALRRSTLAALTGAGLVCLDRKGTMRPRFTMLTELGREVVCCVLGQYADALVRCGLLDKPVDFSVPSPLRAKILTEA